MTAETFRKDKFLRASGYNFYVWAVVNVLILWPVWAALDGRPWPAWLALFYPIALIAFGIFLAALNDNRVNKMWGPPNDPPVVDAATFWGPIFMIGLVLTIVLTVRGPAAYIQPVWLLLIGAAYWIWGSFGIPEFRWLGWTLVAAGAIAGLAVHPETIPPHLGSRDAMLIWVVFMGALWLPFGAWINRKYVAPRERAQELG
jgi:hypothetical protein